DEAELRAGLDSLLARIAEFAPEEAEESEAFAPAPGAAMPASPAPETVAAAKPAEGSPKSARQEAVSKTVRVSLGRLDRMMNNVGELVINRTRMVGRVSELRRLIDTLSFSKERLQGKVGEFQDKYEFNRISNSGLVAGPAGRNAIPTPDMLSSAAAGDR